MLASLGMFATGCATDQAFVDDLRFGSDIDLQTYTLVGETDTFTRSGGLATVWFRVESSMSFDGRIVRLTFNDVEYVDMQGCAKPATVRICLTAPVDIANAGTYQVKAYLMSSAADPENMVFVAERKQLIE
jgi:hypothetical protein